jgi:murein L,D-transpeptidase YafK
VKRLVFFALLCGIAVLGWRFNEPIRSWALAMGFLPKRTVQQVLDEYGAATKKFFVDSFRRKAIAYPPKRLQLIALKRERLLEVWASNAAGDYKFICEFPILAMSGGPGVKRKEGDKQVPEGFYKLTGLNPNSRYHLSIKVNYPNATDDANAATEKQGGDIFIHGSNVSIGCIAIGNESIEKVFCLTALTPAQDRRVLIAPCDFRIGKVQASDAPWVGRLYKQIADNMRKFRRE